VTAAVVRSGDLLSAQSLILAAVTGLMALWYGDMQSALTLSKPVHLEDRTNERAKLKAVFWRRAILLAALATGAAAIFVPNSVSLVRRIAPLFHGHVPGYDVLAVSVVAVNALMVLLALYICGLAIALARRRREFGKN
jgi:hypothetical protein